MANEPCDLDMCRLLAHPGGEAATVEGIGGRNIQVKDL